MKKILFATTALALSAGAAAADVSFTGFGRFAYVYDDPDAGDSSTYLEQRLQLDILGTTETDGGLTLGGKFRTRSYDDGDANTTTNNGMNAGQMFVSAGGLKVEVGNVDGALDNMSYIGLGTIGISNFVSPISSFAYSSTGTTVDTGVAAIYSMGAFGAHVSYDSNIDKTDAVLSFTTAGYTFSIGGSDYDDDSEWTKLAASVGGELAGVDFGLGYANNGDAGDFYTAYGQFGIAAGTTIGAYLMYGDQDDNTGVGADIKYDLGGGAALKAGVYNDDDGTFADAGVQFNF
ncbi:porin [Pseudooceanicola sp. CBS1P-1]|uniref:Porin n=1 Tax=Pseudooceanicola albus TaxID=2692189 RepID=A0A6L7FYS8_9RHOB|nr:MULTISPECIES: porin [Pseudooceanicola]MBT9383996.1 porin [Pseudooceanicola endophyticus]MXN16592.1 porin [Pseudooceanicola albus]